MNITMINITNLRVLIINRRKILVPLIMKTHFTLNGVDLPTDEVSIAALVVPVVVLTNLVNLVVVTVVAVYIGSTIVLT